MLLDDRGLSGSVLVRDGGIHIWNVSLCTGGLDGIRAAKGSLRETGGSSLREVITFPLLKSMWLRTDGWWICTCFFENDRYEIAVALLSCWPSGSDKWHVFSKKDSNFWDGEVVTLACLFSSSVASPKTGTVVF